MDKEADIFRLKDEYIPFWRDEPFRKMLRERVEFMLVRYFMNIKLRFMNSKQRFQQRPKLFSDRLFMN
jgi:hypothetical protein